MTNDFRASIGTRVTRRLLDAAFDLRERLEEANLSETARPSTGVAVPGGRGPRPRARVRAPGGALGVAVRGQRSSRGHQDRGDRETRGRLATGDVEVGAWLLTAGKTGRGQGQATGTGCCAVSPSTTTPGTSGVPRATGITRTTGTTTSVFGWRGPHSRRTSLGSSLVGGGEWQSLFLAESGGSWTGRIATAPASWARPHAGPSRAEEGVDVCAALLLGEPVAGVPVGGQGKAGAPHRRGLRAPPRDNLLDFRELPRRPVSTGALHELLHPRSEAATDLGGAVPRPRRPPHPVSRHRATLRARVRRRLVCQPARQGHLPRARPGSATGPAIPTSSNATFGSSSRASITRCCEESWAGRSLTARSSS